MDKLETKVFAFLPLSDELGQKDKQKVQKVAKFFSRLVAIISFLSFCFHVVRVFWCYDHLPINSLYYGLMGAMASQLGLQGMNVAFSILYIVGVNKKQQSFVFLWIISIFVLLSLETIVVIYCSALKDHSGIEWDGWSYIELVMYISKFIIHLPAVAAAVIFYRAVEDEFAETVNERQFLL